MPSKTIQDRRKLHLALQATLAVPLPGALAALGDRLGPFLEAGDDLSTLPAIQGVLSRLLASREAEMVAADEALFTHRLDRRAPIRRRNELVRELRDCLLHLRKAMQAVFGNEQGNELLALVGRLTEDPLRLHQQATLTLQRLRDPDLPTPEPRLPGVRIDRAAYADTLESLVEELAEVLAVVDRNRQVETAALVIKTRAVERYDAEAHVVAGLLTSLFRLSGRPALGELAKRTRPVSRQRPRVEDVEALSETVGEPAASSSQGGAHARDRDLPPPEPHDLEGDEEAKGPSRRRKRPAGVFLSEIRCQ